MTAIALPIDSPGCHQNAEVAHPSQRAHDSGAGWDNLTSTWFISVSTSPIAEAS